MAQVDYSAFAATALQMLKDYGQGVVLRRITTPGVYDPVTCVTTGEVVTNFSGVAAILPATLARFARIDNKLVESGDLVITKARLVLLASRLADDSGDVPQPDPEDRMTFDGALWRVMGCSPLMPAGVPVLHQVAVILDQ